MEYKIRKFQNPSSTLQYFTNLNAEAQRKYNSPEERTRRAFNTPSKSQEEHNTPGLRTDRNGLVSVDYENQGDYVPTTAHKIGTALQDTGTQLLHGVQTFGSSLVGDAVKGFSPKAADWLERNTFGVISQTPQEKIDRNRQGNWNRRITDTANSVSTAVGFGSLGGVGRAAVGTKWGQNLVGSKLGQMATKQGTRFMPKNKNLLINQDGFNIPNIGKINPSHTVESAYIEPIKLKPKPKPKLDFKGMDLKTANFKNLNLGLGGLSMGDIKYPVNFKGIQDDVFSRKLKIPSKYFTSSPNLNINKTTSTIDVSNLLNSNFRKKDSYISPMGDMFNIPLWRSNLEGKVNTISQRVLKPIRTNQLKNLSQGSTEEIINNYGESYLNSANSFMGKFKNRRFKRKYNLDVNLAAKENRSKFKALQDVQGVSDYIQIIPEDFYRKNYPSHSSGVFSPHGSYKINSRLYKDSGKSLVNTGTNVLSTRHWNNLGGLPQYQTINPHSRVVLPQNSVSGLQKTPAMKHTRKIVEHELRHGIDSGLLRNSPKGSNINRDIGKIYHDSPTKINFVEGKAPSYDIKSNTYSVPTENSNLWPLDIRGKTLNSQTKLSDYQNYLRSPWETTAYLNTNLRRSLVDEGMLLTPNTPISKRVMRWAIENPGNSGLNLHKGEIKDYEHLRKMLNIISFKDGGTIQ